MIESLNSEFDDDLLTRLEQEKIILDDKVERARFGYVVSRKQYY